MTDQDPAPFRPDVWGGDPDRAAPDTGTGRPLDLSQDPDRVVPDTGTGRPLDLSQDPDRVPPVAQPRAAAPLTVPLTGTGRPLDPARDPDRVRPGDRTLTELLGDGAQEESRDSYTWALGLLAVLAFLALVGFIASRLGPG